MGSLVEHFKAATKELNAVIRLLEEQHNVKWENLSTEEQWEVAIAVLTCHTAAPLDGRNIHSAVEYAHGKLRAFRLGNRIKE